MVKWNHSDPGSNLSPALPSSAALNRLAPLPKTQCSYLRSGNNHHPHVIAKILRDHIC